MVTDTANQSASDLCNSNGELVMSLGLVIGTCHWYSSSSFCSSLPEAAVYLTWQLLCVQYKPKTATQKHMEQEGRGQGKGGGGRGQDVQGF